MPDPIALQEVFHEGAELGAGLVDTEPNDYGLVGLHVEVEGNGFASVYLTPLSAARLAERLLRSADNSIPTEGADL